MSLRLLGEEPNSEYLTPARKWIQARGGAVMIPSWGKFWIAVLGCHRCEIALSELLPQRFVHRCSFL